MSELNIPVPQHNPLSGQSNTLADNVRKAEELKLKRATAKAAQRKDKIMMDEYWTKKKTENYVFSHYPSGSHVDWQRGYNGLKYTAANKAKHRRDWLSSVGGNLAGFEQYWQQGHKAEMEGLKKSLIYDPSSRKTPKAWNKYVTDTMGAWGAQERSLFFNNMDAETRQYTNAVYTPDEFRDIGEKFDRAKQNIGIWADEWLPGMDTTGQVATTVGATTAGGYALKKAWDWFKDRGEDIEDVADDIKTGTKGAVSGDDASDAFKKIFRTQSGLSDDILNHDALTRARAIAGKLEQSGDLSEAGFRQLQKIIRDLQGKGKDVTTRAIYEGVQALGDKGEGLLRTLSQHADEIGFKGWKNAIAGGVGGIAGGMTAGYLTDKAVTSLVGGKNAEEWGDVGSATATLFTTGPAMTATNIIKDKIEKHGAKKVLMHIGKVAGWRKLSGLMAKQGIGHLFGIGTGSLGYAATGAFLLGDVLYIKSIIEDME